MIKKIILSKIAIIVVLSSLEEPKAECPGDINLDYQVNHTDLVLFSNNLLEIGNNENISLNNSDIDFNNNINILDLIGIIDKNKTNPNTWCDFEPIELDLEWQAQEDSSYFNSELLHTILNNDVNELAQIRGLIVIHRGKIIGEKYYNGSHVNQAHNTWSVTKSFISTLVGQCIDMNFIENEYIMLNEIFYENSNTSQVSIKNLLTMSSGWADDWLFLFRPNFLNRMLEKPLENSPGTTFLYNNAACHLNSYVIHTTTGLTPKQFAMEHLFPDLGIDNPNWNSDWENINNGSYDLRLTLREMVKLGQLYLQKGKSGQEQILSSSWIEKATSGQINEGTSESYGYLWWLTGPGYLALGAGGQFIVVIPDLQLIIGTQSSLGSNIYVGILLDIIYSHIVPIFDIADNMIIDRNIIENIIENENSLNNYK